MEKIAPLSGGFLIAGFVLFFVSLFKIWPVNKSWGFTMIFFSIILIVASLVSMTYADAKSLLKVDHIKLSKKK